MAMKTWQSMGWSKNSTKREVHRNTILPQDTRTTTNTQPNFTPKTTRKRTKNSKTSRRKEIIKMWAEINEKEIKETIANKSKQKADSLRR